MTGPKVVSIESGQPYDVYVGRGKRGTKLKKSKWHNPYVVGKDGTLDECLEKFERYLKASPLMTELPEIKGKTLACHCAPKSCHADILLRLANANVSGITNGDVPLSSDLEPGEGATLEQLQRIRVLKRQGMREDLAREEVLGKGWVGP